MAAPEIDIRVNSTRLQLKLDAMPAQVRARLRSTADILEAEILAGARAKASGSVLHVKSGSFLRSIKGSVTASDKRVAGRTTSHDPRAHLFEFGGETKARDILPNAKQALAFALPTGKKLAAIVHRPEVDYEPHSVIHATFEEMKGDIEADLRGAVRDGVMVP